MTLSDTTDKTCRQVRRFATHLYEAGNVSRCDAYIIRSFGPRSGSFFPTVGVVCRIVVTSRVRGARRAETERTPRCNTILRLLRSVVPLPSGYRETSEYSVM